MNLHESSVADRQLIDKKLIEFNKANVAFQQVDDWVNLSHVLKDSSGSVVAGINATLYCWNILYIEVLYVDDVHRGKGYGTQLLEAVEDKARQLGGYMVHLDTFDWQAKEFYVRMGYSVFGILDNCPPGHTRSYLTKLL